MAGVQALRAQLLHHILPRGEARHAGEAAATVVHVPVRCEDDAAGQVVAAAALEVIEVVRGRDLDSVGVLGHLHQLVVHYDGQRLVGQRVDGAAVLELLRVTAARCEHHVIGVGGVNGDGRVAE